MSLNELYAMLRDLVGERHPQLRIASPAYDDFRPGDVRHSQADIAKAQRLLGYQPTHDARLGLRNAVPWYEASFSAQQVMHAPDTTDVRGVA
jgi:UDP-N-acetylglucosamine 4-epimerase